MKDLKNLLNKTSKKQAIVKTTSDTLASKIDQFDKADHIMEAINSSPNTSNQILKKDKTEYVTYAIPGSYTKIIDEKLKACMRKEIVTNKSEMIRLGIKLIDELSLEELEHRILEVKTEKGRPKNIK